MTQIVLTSDIEVTPVQQMGGDHMVVAAARVSKCGEDALRFADPMHKENNTWLIDFLIRMRHGTPFEHGASTFFVHAPIFVFREWHRHRIGFSYNEESARYRPLAPLFWIPRRDRAMVPVENWKPGRPKFLTLDEAEALKYSSEVSSFPGCIARANDRYAREIARDQEVYELAYRNYRQSIDDGIAMEVARCKLPVGIYSSCWVTCNPRSIMAFLSLRTHDESATYISYPQAEIEEAARVVEEDIFKAHWPITHESFCRNGRVAP